LPLSTEVSSISSSQSSRQSKEILDIFPAISLEYRFETLHRLQKLIPTAQALVEETGDKDLHEIVVAIATQVANTGAVPG